MRTIRMIAMTKFAMSAWRNGIIVVGWFGKVFWGYGSWGGFQHLSNYGSVGLKKIMKYFALY